MRHRDHRRGMTLIELIVVIGAFAIAMNFGAVILLAAMRVDQLSAETVQRLTRHTQLADMFRDDVASALSAPDSIGEWKRSKTCVLLRQSGDRWVIYRFENRMFEQVIHTPDGELHRPIPLGSSETQLEFDRDGNVLILRITEQKRGLNGLPREVRAALGGDVK